MKYDRRGMYVARGRVIELTIGSFWDKEYCVISLYHHILISPYSSGDPENNLAL